MRTALVLLGIILMARSATAQETNPTDARPILNFPTGATLTRFSDQELHAHLLSENASYRSARSQKIAGILTASIGGGAGVLTMIVGLALWKNPWSHEHSDYRPTWISETPGLLCIGAGVTALSLGVGLPLAIDGHSQMQRIRTQSQRAWLPTVNVSTGPGGGYVEARWRF